MFETVPVVSALRPSEVASRARETGAPPPTCTGRPSIPLILFAIAQSSNGVSTSHLTAFGPGTLGWPPTNWRFWSPAWLTGYRSWRDAHHALGVGNAFHYL